MPFRSLDTCARRYAKTWANGERSIYEGLASPDRSVRLAALRTGAGYFRISRNFHRVFELKRGLERLEPVLDVLEEYRRVRLTVTTMRAAVAILRVALGENYGGGDKLSAATKFLWLVNRAPTIIYDSQARFALGTPSGDYDRYVQVWLQAYRDARCEIRKVSAALPDRAVTAVPFPGGKAPEWFLQRVFDIYLWSAGSAGTRLALPNYRLQPAAGRKMSRRG